MTKELRAVWKERCNDRKRSLQHLQSPKPRNKITNVHDNEGKKYLSKAEKKEWALKNATGELEDTIELGYLSRNTWRVKKGKVRHNSNRGVGIKLGKVDYINTNKYKACKG